MKDLDVSKPLFLFRINNKQYSKFTYCVHWKNGEAEEEWNIYQIDSSNGIAKLFKKGKGKSEYRNTLIAAGIDPRGCLLGRIKHIFKLEEKCCTTKKVS
jgi:hypothetical protein